MTTARERMKQLSGLIGAHSARTHFLAITQGTGSGVDRITLTSRLVVCLTEPRCSVVLDDAPPIVVEQIPDLRVSDLGEGEDRIDVFLPSDTFAVLLRPHRMVSLLQHETDVVVLDGTDDVISQPDL